METTIIFTIFNIIITIILTLCSVILSDKVFKIYAKIRLHTLSDELKSCKINKKIKLEKKIRLLEEYLQ